MGNVPFPLPPPSPHFVGREKELAWLDREVNDPERGYNFSPIVVAGPGGIGKTSLIRQFVGQRNRQLTTKWFNAYAFNPGARGEALAAFTDTVYGDRRSRELWIVLDGLDEGRFPHDQIIEAVRSAFNRKAVRALFITSRTNLGLRGQRLLNLDLLPASEAQLLVESLLSRSALPQESMARILGIAKGHPLSLSLITGLARTLSDEQLLRTLEGHLYDLKDSSSFTKAEIITIVKPTIISANQAMVDALRKRPEDIFKLSSRKYEELVAELLSDMGYDVELTPATRDGGKDILAYFKTDCGTFLCLVEAKRYRSDRKIGVELVRTLYGTLLDYQANSAMMVTSSSFSKDAHEFQKRHEYQLSLRDYTDLTGWIQNYGSRTKT
jgi:HJR/Mrr/RecB family endonuclease